MLVVLTAICAVSGFMPWPWCTDVTREPIEYSRLKFIKEPAVKAVLAGYQNDPIKDRMVIDPWARTRRASRSS